MKYLVIVFLFFVSFAKSQVGDNGYPFLYEKLSFERRTARHEYKDSSGNNIPLLQLKGNIKTFEIEGFNNQEIINEISNSADEAYINQNIYGKAFNKEINITDDHNRIEYDGRYYYLYKITSADAKAMQIYFKKYLLTKESKLFFYADNGFILGEFNDKNNPDVQSKGLEFGIQPIPGNTFYIELSYPVGSTDKPLLITEKVIHSFTEFYGGAYGTAGNCHKNVACVFTGNDDKSRNIKSVGLMLYPIYQSGTNTHTYSASCSGNLMNNTAQNGEPYFLTAAHCIGYEAANNNINWNTELITLFNYEAKTCASNGSDAPSTLSNNSVLGCSLLTQSPFTALDYALIKLNVTASVLSQYKVCYAGWDNNPNSYSVNPTNAYGVHHPKGDTKKISFIDALYPVTSNQPITISNYSAPWPQNSQGTFLQTSWRDGIVEKGSSGSPLFNSFDRLVGSLSTGPDPSIFNCNNPNIYNSTGPKLYTYYSRFSNNYYTVSAWLNPNGSNVQSIGPYCPSTPLMIGAPITVTYPPVGNPQQTIWEEEPIDVNGENVHPANTWGKKIYLTEKIGGPNSIQQIDTNFNYYKSIIPSNKNIFSISENIYELYGSATIPNYLPNIKLWGIYKIIDCNKIKYIKPANIIMKNPGTIGQVDELIVDVVGLTDDRVHILISERRFSGSTYPLNYYKTFELQSYKIINNELVFESYKTIFFNQQNTSIDKYYDFDDGHLMLSVFQNSITKVYPCFYSESAGWQIDNNNPIAFGSAYVFTKIVGNKVFMFPPGQNKMDIYNLSQNSPVLAVRASLSNHFISVPSAYNFLYDPFFIFEKSDNLYNIVYKSVNGSVSFYELMQLDLSNNSVNSYHITMPADFKNVPYSGGQGSNFIIKNNEIIRLNKLIPQYISSEYPNYQYINFTKNVNGAWVKDKVNYLKWFDIGGFNNKYIISSDSHYGSNMKRRIFSIREVDYLAHSYTMYDNSTIYSSAYHRPKKIDHNTFNQGILYGKEVFKNLIFGVVNTFLFRAPNYSYDYNSRTYDIKTVILDNKTTPITGNKNVYVYGKYSVVMKPGFSVSSSSGTEFHAIPLESLPIDIPACSFTFEDMLNPKITETPNESIYLKQSNVNTQNQHYLGEIVLRDDENVSSEILDNQNIKIYPNPTRDILYIDLKGKFKDFDNLQVYSADGKIIITKKIMTDTTGISLSQYPTGVYIITLLNKNGKSYPYKVIRK